MYLAGVVVFRFVCASLYIIKWKSRYMYNKKYKIKVCNLDE